MKQLKCQDRFFQSAIIEGILVVNRCNMLDDVVSDGFLKLQILAKFCHLVLEAEKVLIRLPSSMFN